MRTGRVTVTTAVAELDLPIRNSGGGFPDGEVMTRGVNLATSSDNTDGIYVSQNPQITAGTTDSTDGFPIGAGVASFFLPADTFGQSNKLYFRTPAGTQYVWWMLV